MALLPVCMKYTARIESPGKYSTGKAECYNNLSQDSHQELYTFIQTSGSALSVLFYFTLKDSVNRRHSFEI